MLPSWFGGILHVRYVSHLDILLDSGQATRRGIGNRLTMNQHPDFFIACFDLALNTVLPRRARSRVGRHIYRLANGEGDYHGDKNGEYELYTKLSCLLPDPAVVFDVGANVGEW